MGERPEVAARIVEELREIRYSVPGVRGGITATADGLVLAHDLEGLEPTQLAALVAATHAVAVRASLTAECGQLKEVITKGTDGYLAVYAAGPTAIVALIGVSDLNIGMLNFKARTIIDRIAEHAAALTRRPPPGPAASPGGPAEHGTLPERGPAGP